VEILIIAFSAGVFITFLVALVGIGTNSLVRQVFNNTLPFWGLLLFLWFDTFVLTSLVEESMLTALLMSKISRCASQQCWFCCRWQVLRVALCSG